MRIGTLTRKLINNQDSMTSQGCIRSPLFALKAGTSCVNIGLGLGVRVQGETRMGTNTKLKRMKSGKSRKLRIS